MVVKVRSFHTQVACSKDFVYNHRTRVSVAAATRPLGHGIGFSGGSCHASPGRGATVVIAASAAVQHKINIKEGKTIRYVCFRSLLSDKSETLISSRGAGGFSPRLGSMRQRWGADTETEWGFTLQQSSDRRRPTMHPCARRGLCSRFSQNAELNNRKNKQTNKQKIKKINKIITHLQLITLARLNR